MVLNRRKDTLMDTAVRMFIMCIVLLTVPWWPLNLLPKVVVVGILGGTALILFLTGEKQEVL